jgi:lysophospholipase L1-like esterase
MIKNNFHTSVFIALLLLQCLFLSGQTNNTIENSSDFLKDIKAELKKEWPNNRTINLVFHGHSVPAGYFNTPNVKTLDSYPYLVLKQLKDLYPYALINIINTSIGGENSISGAKRFKSEVLIHKPDVLFIDYALNDRSAGLDKSKEAWEKMIQKALDKGIKVILLTPSPDQSENILDPNTVLAEYSRQIRDLSGTYGIGLVDSYATFRQIAVSGTSLSGYMAQSNHPNEKGHLLIANEIIKYFR